MQLYSTNDPSIYFSLKEAVFKGLPDDGGLFMPKSIPDLSPDFFNDLAGMSFSELAMVLANRWLGEEVDSSVLKSMVNEVFNFEVPLVQLQDKVHVLELFHGPTLAFKDFGARFMSRLMGYYLEAGDQDIHVLVATSGDTGSAVGQGFHNVPGIKVVILYPHGQVSHIQEQQLTTIGDNVSALEIEGTFDDCQKMVKQAFLDQELRQQIRLTSANSINIARLLPQSFYYFYAFGQMPKGADMVASVPSGNYGNLFGGLLAKRMGLPIDQFVAASNANRIVPHYLDSGLFEPKPSIRTTSNAMDVGNPSNFARIMDLYGNSWEAVKNDIAGFSYDDEQVHQAIKELYERTGYTIDPHSTIGFLGLKDYLRGHSEANGFFLATAHPSKFSDVVGPIIGKEVQLPERLKLILKQEKQAVVLPNDLKTFKNYLLSAGSYGKY